MPAAFCGRSRALPPPPPRGSRERCSRYRGPRPTPPTCRQDVLSSPGARTGCPRAASALRRRPGRRRGTTSVALSMEAEEPLVRVSGLSKRYPRRGDRRARAAVLAVAHLGLTITPGAHLGSGGGAGFGDATPSPRLAPPVQPTPRQT